MILFLICSLVCSVFTIVYIIDDFDHDTLSGCSLFMSILSGATLTVFILLSIISHINVEAKVLELEAEKEAIVYQLENETYLNDNNLGTIELFKQASEFNQKVIGGAKKADNLWTNWLYSPAYKEVEPIIFGEVTHG